MSDILNNHDQSIFYDENGEILDHKILDRKKQLDAYTFIPSDSVVLELGSRYGIVSCLINKGLKNPKHHLVMTDDRYIDVLTKNRDKNNCQFQIGNQISLSLKEIEARYSLNFNVILCEESVFSLIEDNDRSKFKLILLEREPPCDHLIKLGFACVGDTYFNENLLPFHIISHQAGHGNIGLFGQLGHISEINHVMIDNPELYTISLHAPSNLIIETQEELIVRGYASPTAQDCPILNFELDGQLIGNISSKGDKTNSYRILPGKHELITTTSTLAWAHSVWLLENINKYIPQQKYFKIDLYCDGCGLMYQLINLMNGISLSSSVGRYIYNPNFLLDFDKNNWIPLSAIIDIRHLNQMLNSLNLNVQIITNEIKEKWIRPEYYNTVCSTNFRNKIVDKLSKEEYPYLDIGDVFSLTIEKDDKVELELYKNIRFMPEFYVAINYIKNNFLGEEYNVVHLRLEDDFIAHNTAYYGHAFEKYTTVLLNRYLEAMRKVFSSEDKIYLATHLLKASYINNYVINLIREEFPNIVTTVPWRTQVNLPLGKQVNAIVDYLISLDAKKFVGMHGSDFSILISRIRGSSQLINSYVY